MSTAFLHGDRVALHAPTDDDAAFVADALAHPDVWQSMDRVRPTTERETADRLADHREDDDAFPFVARAGGDRVGFVRLRVLNAHWRNASLTYWVAPAHQGEGHGRDAVRTVLEFGFDHLGLHKLLAMTFETNEASQRLLESLGFDREAEFASEVTATADTRTSTGTDSSKTSGGRTSPERASSVRGPDEARVLQVVAVDARPVVLLAHAVEAVDAEVLRVELRDAVLFLDAERGRLWRGRPLVDVVLRPERRRDGRDLVEREQPLDGGLAHRPFPVPVSRVVAARPVRGA